MKLTFQQSGGFAGLSRGCELDTDQMDHEEAARLQRLIETSGLLGATDAPPRAPFPDAHAYQFTITDAGHTRHVILTDSDLTDELMPLIDALRSRSKPMRIT